MAGRSRAKARASSAKRSSPSVSKPGGLPKRVTFVTGNAGKVRELTEQLAPFGIAVGQDKRGYPEIQADTLAEVAEAGAVHLLASGLKPPFLLEDSGLFVAALRGFPGVYSRHTLDTVGCAGVLRLLRDVEAEMRAAAFRSHLLYVDAAGRRHGFEGTCAGRIVEVAAGSGGFGFDPIFAPRGHDQTFAEMEPAEKAALGHRGQAVRAFLAFLEKSTKA